jgi:hypothetical protein
VKKPKSHEKDTGRSKYECNKGKSNGHMPKTNEQETKFSKAKTIGQHKEELRHGKD